MNRADLRVLIADDSSLARSMLRELLEADPRIQVIGEARDGRQAVELAAQLRPDLITMDLNMPVMDGIGAIEAIMHQKAVPILVVSQESDALLACKALDAGALEVMTKPDYRPEQAAEFVRKVRLLSGVSVFTRMRRWNAATPARQESAVFTTSMSAPTRPNSLPVLAIASSTGGPQALAQILPRFTEPFPATILIAQHICDGFIDGMAQWLDKLCQLHVQVASDGDIALPGRIYLSPSESNLELAAFNRLSLQPRAPGEIYHPSCDRLLCSVAEVAGPNAIGLILTGMGRDGAQGISCIRQRGGRTLAQDEATSVIFGMNQEAIRTGDVQQILALPQIPERVVELLAPNQIEFRGAR